MAKFFTADWHLGDNRLEQRERPFKTIDEMHQRLIYEHNKIVTVNDTTYHLGDICHNKNPEYLPLVKCFNGHKILIRGNHDRIFSDQDLAPYFDQIFPEGEGHLINDDSIPPLYLIHYPTRTKSEYFNLVGHVHNAWRIQLNMLNVGVDVHHYAPIPLKSVAFIINRIRTLTDLDVWAAYLIQNSKHQNQINRTSYADQIK